MEQYASAIDGGATTLVIPDPGVVVNGTQSESSRLALFLVVNAAIVGIAATVLLGAFEIAVHLLP